jgi:hypothetical protein
LKRVIDTFPELVAMGFPPKMDAQEMYELCEKYLEAIRTKYDGDDSEEENELLDVMDRVWPLAYPH